jgi:hypothetical protein
MFLFFRARQSSHFIHGSDFLLTVAKSPAMQPAVSVMVGCLSAFWCDEVKVNLSLHLTKYHGMNAYPAHN